MLRPRQRVQNVGFQLPLPENKHQHPACKLYYEPEPDLLLGAMYVKYAFSVTILVALCIAVLVFAHDLELFVYMTALAITNVLMMALNFNYLSMEILYLFAGFD